MINRIICLFFISFSLVLNGQSNYVNVKIHEGPAHRGPEEPSIAISLKDTSILVAGANIYNAYYSHDGGRTWNHQLLESKYGVWGDPVVESNSKGKFFFFHLSDPTGLNWSSDEILDRIVVQHSRAKGKRWSKGKYMGLAHPKDQDKEWAAIDPVSDSIAVAWTQFDTYGSTNPEDKSNILVSVSNKRGKRWSEPVRINEISGDCIDDDGTTEGAVPAFGPGNRIYVAWSLNEKIWFDYSVDGGKTWQEKDILISEQPGGWTQDIPGLQRCNGMPVTLVDRTGGKYDGTIYVNWTDQRNGPADTDVFVSKSIDGGLTWSNPIQVNNDSGIVAHQFLSAMTIDRSTGYLYCVFYDRRNYLDNRTDVYLAISKDGGETWSNERISESPFIPESEVFFGDYNDISVVDGMVRPIWTRLEAGKLSIHTALIYK
jgi:Neuraminidase (sialidase)